jgi:S1-C subfamily serine protease
VFELEPTPPVAPTEPAAPGRPLLGLVCLEEAPGLVRVEGVQEHSTARAAGVMARDVLLALEVGGKAHEVQRLDDVRLPMAGPEVGAQVTFVVRRTRTRAVERLDAPGEFEMQTKEETLRLSAALRGPAQVR